MPRVRPPQMEIQAKNVHGHKTYTVCVIIENQRIGVHILGHFLCCTSIALFYVCVLLGLSMCCSNACFYVCRVVIAFVVERHRSNLYHASTR
jgi:hypothetical protein